MAAACPCGSGQPFGDCCRPLLRGQREAATASALMRSRYTAFVRGDEAYLKRTWDPATCPDGTLTGEVAWRGLEVLASTGGEASDSVGSVTFVAHFEGADGVAGTMRERSQFRRDQGRWLYVDGEVS